MKLDMDEERKAPYMFNAFFARFAQGWIKGGVKIFYLGLLEKKLLIQTGRLQQQTECLAMI